MLDIAWRIGERLLGGVFDLIDQSVEDKDKANELKDKVGMRVHDRLRQEMASARDIIVAEAQGEGWLQRNWRPMVMVFFAGIIGAWWFGWTPERATPELMSELFELIKIGLGGYVIGRSAEKSIKVWKQAS